MYISIPKGKRRESKTEGIFKILAANFPKLILCQSAQAALTKSHRLHGLNNRELRSHNSGGWKSKISVLAGHGQGKGLGRISSRSFSQFMMLSVILGVLWLVDHHSNLCLHCHGVFSLCVFISSSLCACLFSSCKDPGHIGLGSTVMTSS